MIDLYSFAPETSGELALATFTTLIYALGVLSGLAIYLHLAGRLLNPKKAAKKSKPVEVQKRGTRGEARNAAAVLNASVDFQKIKTAEIEIPVIAADVLTYEGGELGASYPERTRLYYTPEALSDPEYLETVLRSPLQIQTHEKNTSEFNRGVDGWPLTAEWDETESRVKVKGVLHGEENVRYAEENRNKPNFGTSAYISFLEIERTPGIAPNGKPFDAVVRKAVNNHIAILPNVRDPKNIILAMNAVKEEPEMQDTKNANIEQMRTDRAKVRAADDAWQAELEKEFGKKAGDMRYKPEGKSTPRLKALYDDYRKAQDSTRNAMEDKDADNADPSFHPSMVRSAAEKAKELADEKKKREKEKAPNAIKNEQETKRMPIDKEDFKEAMMAYQEDGKKEEELVNKIKNAVLNELKPSDDKPADKPAENADEEKPVEEKKDEASNALPSESMVKDFSDALGITFKKVPSLADLAAVAGVNSTGTPAELIAALNAKRETLRKPAALNAGTPAGAPVSIDYLIKQM